jgi:hypothetical protein
MPETEKNLQTVKFFFSEEKLASRRRERSEKEKCCGPITETFRRTTGKFSTTFAKRECNKKVDESDQKNLTMKTTKAIAKHVGSDT